MREENKTKQKQQTTIPEQIMRSLKCKTKPKQQQNKQTTIKNNHKNGVGRMMCRKPKN